MSGPFLLPFESTKPYTVSQINSVIRDIIESSNTLIWAEGEISNFKRASSGHCYFKLKDAQSRIPAVIWRSNYNSIGFDPGDGMSVTVIASVKVYQQGGYYQLNINRMNLAGRGELFAAFERLKQKLQKEGLFDPEKKKPLPETVNVLGVITSKRGAAVRDIIKVAAVRSPRTNILVRDVAVQGEKAPAQIVRAIREMNEYKRADCIVVGRGGGSVEDLQPFNEEVVAMAIFESEIPVISAVGHEIDFTISDFAADFRAPTPSASAEAALKDDTERKRRLEDSTARFSGAFMRYLEETRERLDRCKSGPGFKNLVRVVYDYTKRIDKMQIRLARAAASGLDKKYSRLSALTSRLNSLSPLSVMSRGYSVVSDSRNKILKSVSGLKENDRVRIRFFRGEAGARIEDVSREDKK